MSDIVPAGFDYSQIPDEKATRAKEAAFRIHLHGQQVLAHYIAIGDELAAVKEDIGHGHFLAWVDGEFGLKERSARYYMQIAERFGPNRQSFADLPKLSIPALSAIASAPEEIGDQVIEDIKSGEVKPTTAAIQEAVRAAKEDARRARQEADEARKQSQAVAQQLSFEKQLAATREAKLRALEAQAQQEPAVIERVVEVPVEVVPPNLAAQLDAVKANLAQSETERKKLAAHAAQLEEDAIAASRLAQKEDKPDWRIRNAWAEQATALIRAMQQGLGAYPSSAETFALQQYEWGLASEIRKLLARHQECLDAMQHATIVDAA